MLGNKVPGKNPNDLPSVVDQQIDLHIQPYFSGGFFEVLAQLVTFDLSQE